MLPARLAAGLALMSFASMKALFGVTTLLELGAGVALLCFPSPFVVVLVGKPLGSPAALTVARVGGAALLALGLACWIARGDTQNRAAFGLTVAMLFYNVAAVAVLAYSGVGYGLYGPLLWPGVVLHGLMGVWCLACAVGNSR